MIDRAGAIIIEGHVQGLSNTRSLGEAGVPVFVVDKTNCIARYSRYCSKFFRCPDYSSDELASFLVELAIKKKLNGWVLFPCNDHAVFTLSRNKELLEEHFRMITPSLDIIENIYDKSKLLNIAVKCDVPIPATQYFTSAYEKLSANNSFPVITKGKNGLSFYKSMGRKAFLARNEQELQAQLKLLKEKIDIRRTLTQEVIAYDGSNKTVSFAAFCELGEIKAYWIGVKLREHPLQFGTATFAQSIHEMECYELSEPLLKALDYTGICEVEYLKDPCDGRYKLIEINARTWLWVGLARACGVDFAMMAYEYTNGIDTVYPKEYETGVYWINPFTDIAYASKGLLTGKLSLLGYARSICISKKVSAIFAGKDWKPGFAYCLNIFKYLRDR